MVLTGFTEQPPKYNHSLPNIWSEEHMKHVWGADSRTRRHGKRGIQKYVFDWDGINPNDKVIMLRPGETIFLGRIRTNSSVDCNSVTTMDESTPSSMGRNFIEGLQMCRWTGATWGM